MSPSKASRSELSREMLTRVSSGIVGLEEVNRTALLLSGTPGRIARELLELKTAMPLKIAQLGQPVLRAIASEVSAEEIRTPEFQQFIDDMLQTLADARG